MLHLLRSFCAVVEAGSLNRAAEGLHLTQPAVTRHIAALEHELGARLLLRGPRGVTLTPAGQEVYGHARRALAAVRACHNAAAGWATPDRGRLAVGAGLTLILFTLPPVIGEFRRRHPAIQVEVRSGTSREVLGQLLAYEVDLAFVTSPVESRELRSYPLFVDPLVVAAAPNHPPAAGWGAAAGRGPHRPPAAEVALEALAGQTLIALRPGSGLRQYVDQVLEGRGISPRVVMEFDSIEAIKTMVTLGLGLALLPWSSVRDDFDAGLLVAARPAGWPDPGRTVALVVRRDGYRTGAMRRMIALARLRLGRTAEGR